MNATIDSVNDSVNDSGKPANSWFAKKSTNSRVTDAKNNIDSDKSLFEINQLEVCYHGVPALKGINLKLAKGHITALIGPSGCGKSSLLNCLNRMTDLIAHCTINGQIIYDKHDINSNQYDVTYLRRQVGMIFQKPNPLPLSIAKNFELPLKEQGITDPHAINHIMEHRLRDVGLWQEVKNRLKKSALQLSGGQQQRLCIARALALDPAVILLDEPCSALDPLSSALVEDLIKQMREKYTVVIVTHNLAQAKRISDFTALLWLQDGIGQVIEFGATPNIFSQPQNALTAAYISGARG